MNYKIFVSELRVYKQYVYEINKLKARIEEIEYLEAGVKGVRFDNVPSTFNQSLSEERRLELIEQKAEIEKEVERLEMRKQLVIDEFEKLDTHTKLMCLEIMNGKTLAQIGEVFGYTESGVMRKLKRGIEKA